MMNKKSQLYKIIRSRYRNLSERSHKYNVKCPSLEELYSEISLRYTVSTLCPYCGDRIDLFGKYENSPSFDHIIPLTNGGNSSLENLAFVHTKCNLVKGTTSYELFMMSLNGIRAFGGQEKVREYLLSAYKGAKVNKITRCENETR
jgi:5-methylcytosine-specific restriction endonuclease McrA